NSLTNDRAHRRSKEAEIHDCNCNFITVKNSVSADHSVEEIGPFLIFFEPIFVADHCLKAQNVDGPQVASDFYESVRVERTLDTLPCRFVKMIIELTTNE